MISIGRGLRWYNNYQDEVNFCINNGFDFMQFWFKNGEILVNNISEPKEVIVHPVSEKSSVDNDTESKLARQVKIIDEAINFAK